MTVSFDSCKALPFTQIRHVAKETGMYMNDITWFRQVKINPCDSHLLRHPFWSMIVLRVLQCEKHSQYYLGYSAIDRYSLS